MLEIKGKYTTAFVMIDSIDEATMGQIVAFVNDPSFTGHVAIMPDTHYGKGAVIGFTIPLGDRVIPYVIGVDISCGMLMYILSLDILDRDRKELDDLIRANIVMGTNVNKKPVVNVERAFPWKDLQVHASYFTTKYNNRFMTSFRPPEFNFAWFKKMCERVGEDPWYAQRSLGTLGGGNHFVEIGYDDNSAALVVHSGSRHMGLSIAEHWQSVAVARAEERRKDFQEVGIKAIKENNPKHLWEDMIKDVKAILHTSKGLEWLSGEDAYGYYCDSMFAHFFASESRKYMAGRICELLGRDPQVEIETVHNYIDFRDLTIRKGAVSAHAGELFILPFNMEDGILLCAGKGNAEWNNSAPHGAGREHAREEAKRMFTEAPARSRMEAKDIYSSVMPLDELPEAYKDPKEIEAAIGPTAEIINRFKPWLNIKGRGK